MDETPACCPECGTEFQVLLFMGVEPDGFVCPKCKKLYRDANSKTPSATIIGWEE